MEQNVLRPVIGHHEAVTLRHIEPLDDAGNLDKIDRSLFLQWHVGRDFGSRFGPHMLDSIRARVFVEAAFQPRAALRFD